MGLTVFCLLSLILVSRLAGGVCPPGLVESVLCRGGSCADCVPAWSLLLGGSYSSLLQLQWRRDVEIWTEEGPLPLHLPDFPYSLDHPFAWWSSALQSVLVCGGKNWEEEESSSQCWRWLHCEGLWRHELDLPLGIHGGASVRSVGARGEELWLVGGGNGTAFSHVFKLSLQNGSWEVSEEFQLREARYGHCAALVGEDKIVVIGGHSEAIVESVEILNISNNTMEDSSGLRTPSARWGLSCVARDRRVLVLGGMDSYFLPHNNLDILDLDSGTWSQGPPLPWAQSGASLTVMEGGPTLFSGMGLLGFSTRVASLDSLGHWRGWADHLRPPRVSGLGVAIPSDLFHNC